MNKKLYEMCDCVVTHAQDDHKYVFFPGNEPNGLVKDKKGRIKGSPYIRNKKKIYDVVIDMYESSKYKDPVGDLADIWVGTRKDAEKQLEKIREGKGGGIFFMDILPGAKKRNRITAHISRVANMTNYLDRIATELEEIDPRLALALDRVSDRLEKYFNTKPQKLG